MLDFEKSLFPCTRNDYFRREAEKPQASWQKKTSKYLRKCNTFLALGKKVIEWVPAPPSDTEKYTITYAK